MPDLRCRFGTIDPISPWTLPEGVETSAMVRAQDGRSPRLRTNVGIVRDDHSFRVVFDGTDDQRTVASLTGHDEPLWKEDVFEVFLAPNRPEEYFEMELNPLATRFDARIVSPDGRRATMSTDLGWGCRWSGAVRRDGVDGVWRIRASIDIPFEGLAPSPPQPGQSWLANFYRIDRSPTGDEYLAWSPTFADPPDFHIPEHFGRILF